MENPFKFRKLLASDFIVFLVIVNFYVLNVSAIHLTGTWNSKKDFQILTKFGFQKTTQHDIELSEGYIFGNISSLLSIDNKKYGQFVLLPHQYFVPFYQNRSYFYGDKDVACQRMFENINSLAYDARCHDNGQEDFIRKIPCPKDRLCSDEDNPKNVFPLSQLTYAIQDINSPRFWYLSLVACHRNATCGWEYTREELRIQYDLQVVNGRPDTAKISRFEYHFSFDKQDTVEIYLVCLLYYGLILVPVQIYAAYKQAHPVTRLFALTLLTQLFGLFFDSLHLMIFSFNGVGTETLHVIGELLHIAAQSFFMILLLLLAKGWAVTHMSLKRPILLITLWLMYTVLIFLLYFWNKTEVDVIEEIDEFQTWPGWLTLALRVVIMGWFLYELRNTMAIEHLPLKLQFLLHFGAATLVWFIYLPIVALIALQVSSLWRFKILLGFTYSANLLAHSFMTYALWPNRSEQYLLLTQELDLTEELAAFDEAPHILNSEENFKLLYSSQEIDFSQVEEEKELSNHT